MSKKLRWTLGLLFLGLLPVLCCSACWLFTFQRDLPRPGWTVSAEETRLIRETCGLEEDESILLFFALDFFTDMEDGSFFTQKRVVNYERGNDPKSVRQARYEDIDDIYIDEQYKRYNQVKIVIRRNDGTAFDLVLLNRFGADRWFFDRLVNEWKSHH
jgi:hypothetical protein